jgi:segregation and condensation protein B
VEVAGGIQLATKPEVYDQMAQVLGRRRTLSLSHAALETLSLIAYKQPMGKAAIEAVRGVSSDGVLRSLIELGLIRVVGREEGLGRAFLYGTTRKFLEHFGLRGIKDLPRPEA